MSYSLVRILSYLIFIAEDQDKTILVILLKDYAKENLTKMQFLFMLLLITSYKTETSQINKKLYKILECYINFQTNNICRTLIRT